MFSGAAAARRSGDNDDPELTEASAAAFETLRQAVARTGLAGDDDGHHAALRAWAMVHGFSHLLLDGQLDHLGGDPWPKRKPRLPTPFAPPARYNAAPEESPMSENRFLDIRTKLAYQEDLVASLNHIVSDQQRKLDEMEAAYRKLIDRVVEQGEELAALRIQDAPPPHY